MAGAVAGVEAGAAAGGWAGEGEEVVWVPQGHAAVEDLRTYK